MIEISELRELERSHDGPLIPAAENLSLADDSDLPRDICLGHRALMHSILAGERIVGSPVPEVTDEYWQSLIS